MFHYLQQFAVYPDPKMASVISRHFVSLFTAGIGNLCRGLNFHGKISHTARNLNLTETLGNNVIFRCKENLQNHNTKYCTYMTRVPQCLSPRPNWDSPTPSLASECVPPPEQKGGGTHSHADEGLGESQFGRLEKKPRTLSTLCTRTFEA
jgi:hypothetical protein